MDIIVVIGVLASILSLVTAAWAIMRFFIRPKLRIHFLAEETFHARRHSENNRSIWLHVMVENSSKYRSAENVRAYVQQLFIVDNKRIERPVPEFNQPLPLEWAHLAGTKEHDIKPRGKSRLDVAWFAEGDPRLHIATPVSKPTGTVKAVEAGTYVLDIACLGDKAQKGQIRLRIYNSGQFEWPIVEYWDRKRGWVKVTTEGEIPSIEMMKALSSCTTATITESPNEYLVSPLPENNVKDLDGGDSMMKPDRDRDIQSADSASQKNNGKTEKERK